MVPMLVYRSERTVVQSKRQIGIDHFTYKLMEKKVIARTSKEKKI